jgi:hypothetical protein
MPLNIANQPFTIPEEILSLFGEPPLLLREDDGAYYTMMEHFAKIVGPTDTIDWFWIKDLTDIMWEIRRMRRLKAVFIETRRDFAHKAAKRCDDAFQYAMWQAAGSKVYDDDDPEEPEVVPVPVPDSEKDTAGLIMNAMEETQRVDRLIASLEMRFNRTLREIDRRRAGLARRLREGSKAMVDAGAEERKAAA